jgi:hypothetical protein
VTLSLCSFPPALRLASESISPLQNHGATLLLVWRNVKAAPAAVVNIGFSKGLDPGLCDCKPCEEHKQGAKKDFHGA